jgi:pyruvate/2-oxoglutarate dehydrogenase complex dihydrolipoamide acyltransferase (E2) component
VSSSRTETADGAGATTLVDVTMPQMGVSVAEGTVVAWRFEIGDRIQADETICEISTDKIDTEVPSPVGGVLAEILVPVDTTVDVGTPLARIAVSGGVEAAASDSPVGDAAPPATERPAPSAPATAPATTPAAAAAATPATPATPHVAPESGASGNGAPPAPSRPGPSRRYSPVVQRIAAEHNVDLEAIPGTGRGGRVRKQDVMAFIESGGAQAEEPPLHIESPYRPDPAPAAQPGGQLSRMRRQIGEHMKRSLEVSATCTTWIETDMTRVEEARKRLSVTALAFVARASIDALREFPALNSWMEGERYTQHSDVNLGIAVSLGEDGLIVPVIHKAHELSVEGLAARIRDLARRARSRQLTPDEVRGGTFTITNPGQYGSIMATPIINQPQVAILDFEAVIKRAVVLTDDQGNDSIAIRPMTIFGLSWDHRALDGAVAAQFLASVKRRLETLTP